MVNRARKNLDPAKRFLTDTLKTASKRAIRKAAETTCDLMTGNKIAEKNYKSVKKLTTK